MSDRRVVFVSFLLMSCGVLAVFECNAQEKKGKAPKEPPPIRNVPQNLPPTLPTGSPAIKPTTGGTPAFSLDDARNYVATHHVPMELSRDTKPVINRAEFLTSREINARLNGANTGFPDDYLLCYVELQGPVTFSGPKGAKVTYKRGVLVFDAHSGNLIIGGGMP